MAILQVRSIDDQLYAALKARAQMENRSVSQEVIAIVKDYLSRPVSKQQGTTNQFLEICGSWADDRDEATIANELRESRVESDERSGNIF